MIDLILLKIQGFRSFNEEQEFPLNLASGFYFLSGENKVDEELEGNGSGKSSVFDALCWVLFGKTVRGLRAGSVKHWFSDRLCRVEVVFVKNGSEYNLVRTFGPNALTIQKDRGEIENTTPEEVEDLLGLNYRAFLYQVVFGQFNKMFFDLGSVERSEVFSTALQLDRWLDRSTAASSQAKQISGFVMDIRNDITSFEGRLEQIRNTDVSEKIEEWRSHQKSRIRSATTELSGISVKLKSYKNRIEAANKEESEVSQKLDDLDRLITKEEKEVQSITTEINELRPNLAVVQSEIRRVLKEKKLKSNLTGTCVVCSQKIDANHIKRVVAELTKDIERSEEKEYKIQNTIEMRSKTKLILKEKVDMLDSKYSNLQSKESQIVEKRTRAKSDLRQALATKQRAESDLTSIQKEKNPYEEQEAQLAKDEERVLDLISKKQEELSKLVKSWKAVEYWVKGFKDLRLFLISQALKELEIEVNDNIDKLGLIGWKIHFDVDKETKSKTIKKGFHVFVSSPQSSEDVLWEAWSGGESQRLRVAGAVGLANMLEARTGTSFNLEVWDEPTQWLSDAGVQDLLDLLYDRARQVRKQVWLVDHRCFDYGHFTDELVVVKTEKGSVIDYDCKD